MRAVLVAGTHSWRNDDRVDWYCPGSPFARLLESYGIAPLFTCAEKPLPFVWSTDVSGFGFGDEDLSGWAAAGVNLFWYCVPPMCPEKRIPGKDLILVGHSHGLQPCLFAAADGLKVAHLISVGSPIRKDMLPVAAKARPNISRWTHIHSDGSDKWQWFGSLFDGRLGIYREHPLADENIKIPKVGHSEILRKPDLFFHWAPILLKLVNVAQPGPDGHP